MTNFHTLVAFKKIEKLYSDENHKTTRSHLTNVNFFIEVSKLFNKVMRSAQYPILCYHVLLKWIEIKIPKFQFHPSYNV